MSRPYRSQEDVPKYGSGPWPEFSADEVAAVAEVLASGKVNYWTGQQGRDFEREFAAFTGVEHAVFVMNGTVALELALRALRLPPGSEVVTTPRTFIASASAIVAAGLVPVFADVDADSGNITPESAAEVLTPRTCAVLVVHLAGWPADMPGFRELCDSRGLALIEDVSQAHGGRIGDRQLGSFGDVSAWSFCQDKIITTGGEGGMVATNSESLWRDMWSYKDHGKSWEAVYEREHPPGFRWLHDQFGTNWRATEMQAAIGRIQYAKLPLWHQARTENARVLADGLSRIPGIRIPRPAPPFTHAYYRLCGRLDLESLRPEWDRQRILVETMSRFGVPIFSGSCSEIYLEEAFTSSGFAPETRLAEASRMTDDSLAFLVHPTLTAEDMHAVTYAVTEVLAEAVA